MAMRHANLCLPPLRPSAVWVRAERIVHRQVLRVPSGLRHHTLLIDTIRTPNAAQDSGRALGREQLELLPPPDSALVHGRAHSGRSPRPRQPLTEVTRGRRGAAAVRRRAERGVGCQVHVLCPLQFSGFRARHCECLVAEHSSVTVVCRLSSCRFEARLERPSMGRPTGATARGSVLSPRARVHGIECVDTVEWHGWQLGKPALKCLVLRNIGSKVQQRFN